MNGLTVDFGRWILRANNLKSMIWGFEEAKWGMAREGLLICFKNFIYEWIHIGVHEWSNLLHGLEGNQMIGKQGGKRPSQAVAAYRMSVIGLTTKLSEAGEPL